MNYSLNATHATPPPRYQSTAARLLNKLVAMGWVPAEAIARALVISDAAMRSYLDGLQPIPLDRQLCLAQFVIEGVPPLARAGRRLRGQVAAAIAFQEGHTQTHSQSPVSSWR